MFEYFPKNYVWSLAVMMTLAQGGQITEVDEACRPLVPLQSEGDEAGHAWTESWQKLARRVEGQGRADEAAGRRMSAASKLKRAALYNIIAERMLPTDDPRHIEFYRQALKMFRDAVALAGDRTEFVTLQTAHGPVPALWCPAEGARGGPAVITVNGLDAFKEFFYLGDTRTEFLARGLSLLLVDQPGIGEALRLNGLPHRYDVEVTVGAAVDWLEQRPEVDPAKIALLGPSLGGYYGVRGAAREPRLAATALLGAIWDFGAMVRRRVEGVNAEESSVPEFVESLKWFFAKEDVPSLLAATDKYTVEDIIGEVKCPLLIVHGETDRQIRVEDARKVYAGATSARERELRVFTREETSSEHCGIDNPSLQIQYIADWLAQRLGKSEGSDRRTPQVERVSA